MSLTYEMLVRVETILRFRVLDRRARCRLLVLRSYLQARDQRGYA